MDSLQGCRLDSAAADSGSSSSLAAVRRDSLTSSKGSLYSTDADRSPSDQVSIAARIDFRAKNLKKKKETQLVPSFT